MTRAGPLRATLLAGSDGLEARHAALIAPGWRSRGGMMLALGGVVALYAAGLAILDISPARIAGGLGRLGDIAALMVPPTPETWSRFQIYLAALGQTLSIAFLGTLTAALLALPVGFLAARNVVANRIVHLLTRRGLDTVRSVDTLVWALIWINVVGLGPFAGALAIMCADFGAFGKLMSEAIETADRRPVEGVLSTGGGRLASIRFGVVPQVLPVFASQVLYFFESNTRSATIIGIVGAGGIGLHLSELIRVLEWQQAAFVILMVLVTVAAIDAVSQRLRAAIIGRRAG
ncbi:phosphonate ABC transporter, permease protein PhnE [Limobrevibacterium gyesilva]|uniref:Phosphonate ABC transporter, permease protein PhnE n=1 Tax=Limobrevibacterium gyesilva TaxID=2991712 RepID=A0AA42CK40_9PROT|nr:phosphonate ABC transporter, permease protein PhnE [Limobrevibacterium gyesilva]MCW3477512.1 phosphonate ABC transporter, permease protein PhnE [Limobrevibacterium gyesilva]